MLLLFLLRFIECVYQALPLSLSCSTSQSHTTCAAFGQGGKEEKEEGQEEGRKAGQGERKAGREEKGSREGGRRGTDKEGKSNQPTSLSICSIRYLTVGYSNELSWSGFTSPTKGFGPQHRHRSFQFPLLIVIFLRRQVKVSQTHWLDVQYTARTLQLHCNCTARTLHRPSTYSPFVCIS